jgi:hypothetical protein
LCTDCVGNVMFGGIISGIYYPPRGGVPWPK